MSGYPLDAFAIFKRSERISLIIPDRMAETLAHWLQSHPGVKWISRARYARGAALGAPEAQQVIGRWHLQKTGERRYNAS